MAMIGTQYFMILNIQEGEDLYSGQTCFVKDGMMICNFRVAYNKRITGKNGWITWYVGIKEGAKSKNKTKEKAASKETANSLHNKHTN